MTLHQAFFESTVAQRRLGCATVTPSTDGEDRAQRSRLVPARRPAFGVRPRVLGCSA